MLFLCGSAHAALPISGQGACQAIENAWHFTNARDNISLAFRHFTQLRIDKTTNIIIGGRQFQPIFLASISISLSSLVPKFFPLKLLLTHKVSSKKEYPKHRPAVPAIISP